MKKTVAFLSLFTSVGTLVCCALPALFVTLGFGAAFAGIVTSIPQLIWISEHKIFVFGIGAFFLSIGAAFQWKARAQACPTDLKLAEACKETKNWSKTVYLVALGLYAIGVFFAFILPRFVAE